VAVFAIWIAEDVFMLVSLPYRQACESLKIHASPLFRPPQSGKIGTPAPQSIAKVKDTHPSDFNEAALEAVGNPTGGSSFLARATHHGLGLHGQEPFALHFLAGKLAGPADSLGLFTSALFGRLFVMTTQFHFAENTLALHLLFERFQGLVDIIVANENLHASVLICGPAATAASDVNGEIKKRALNEHLHVSD
jgi:hypothetical protein